jgi:hypothetical protein
MRVLFLGVLLAGVCGCGVRPLPGAFAHNDYAHARPLLDALDHGFGGVEADVFLVGGELLVGHEEKELSEGRTLRSLYLEPLAQRVRRNGGWIYGRGGWFWLMIDVKSEAGATYAAVREALWPYRGMLTRWRDGREEAGAVTVVLSGNRARKVIEGERERVVAIDGRLEDLEGNAPASLVPWISANWEKTFTWRGEGEMPALEREKLRGIVAKAHEQGRLVRFWATPERPEVWRELRAAGVDLINTDDLAGLAEFLR